MRTSTIQALANALSPLPTDNTHAVYATLDTGLGLHRVRVSDHVDWHSAVAMHESLHRDTETGKYNRPVMFPGYSVYARPVKFFSVRASNDPQWPAGRPVLTVKPAA